MSKRALGRQWRDPYQPLNKGRIIVGFIGGGLVSGIIGIVAARIRRDALPTQMQTAVPETPLLIDFWIPAITGGLITGFAVGMSEEYCDA